MPLQILYGVENHYKDITKISFIRYSKTPEFINNKQLIIPKGDCERAEIFGDPAYGIVKYILVIKNKTKKVYWPDDEVIIDISDVDIESYQSKKLDRNLLQSFTNMDEKLNFIHHNIFMENVNMSIERPEQILACKFLPSNANVLEIGANVGRNTMVMANILDDDKNLVTLECDPITVEELTNHRNVNHCNFRIEGSALSKRKLIQKEWTTIPSDVLLDGYKEVKTITFTALETKYNITFDTLVADCEGALYYIFMDDPDMLDNIKLILMENDYVDITHKETVDKILGNKGFTRIYKEGNGWGPCYDYFYEAWSKP